MRAQIKARMSERLHRLVAVTALAVTTVGPLGAHAVTISVDVDPGTDGIQSARTVSAGDSFLVDIFVSDITDAAPLNAFEFDLDFDSSVLTATSVTSGNFLPGFVLNFQNVVTPAAVEFAEVAFGGLAATGSGVLAQIAFDATADGTSDLILNDVKLSQAFGVPITGFARANGSVTSAGAVVPVPEPASGLLVISALAGIAALRRRSPRVCSPGQAA